MSDIDTNTTYGKSTKKYRKMRCQQIITSYDVETYFTPYDLHELNLLLGSQFKSAIRRINQTYPSDPAHLWVKYDIGDWMPVSWNNLISPKSERQKRHKAMRFAIKDDINELRELMGAECEACKSKDDLQVDHHVPPFMQIADEFIRQHGEFEIINNDDGAGWVFADHDLEAKWIAFHASRATYQILCRSCNASKGAN
jgi:5-methylcytosine-specific restriction endonuclease McrA